MLRRIIFSVLLSAAAPLTGLRAQTPCDIAWTVPVMVSSDSSVPTLPKISLSGGTVHLLWYGIDTTDDIRLASSGLQYARRGTDEAAFTLPVTLLTAGRSLPGYLASAGARVFVTSAAILDTFFGIVLFSSTDSGSTWSGALPVLGSAYPELIFTQDSSIFIQYLEIETGILGLLRSGDGGESWEIVARRIRAFSDVVLYADELHAVGPVPGSSQTEVGYFVSADSGRFWFGPEIVSPEDLVRSSNPRIAVDDRGYFFTAWLDTGEVIMRSSRNGGISWGVWTRLSEERGNVSVDIAADREFVFAAWDRNISDTSGIRGRLSADFGETFCPVIIPGGGSGARDPVVSVKDSTLRVVWVEHSGAEPGVYFREGGLTSNGGILDVPPVAYALNQSYPNPTNGNAFIGFDVPADGSITLELYNVLGERVMMLGGGAYGPGRYTVSTNVSGLPSGVYFYRLTAPGFDAMKKMMVLR